MKTVGFNQPLYILPLDHRGSFETKMFGWHGEDDIIRKNLRVLKASSEAGRIASTAAAKI
jgi:hypothetical protein